MRIVCLSDTHGAHRNVAVPAGDLLIHAGDFCAYGSLGELEDFNNWLGELPHPQKVIIAGNHDICFGSSPLAAENLIKNAVYLNDSAYEWRGLKIWGSPVTPRFFDFAFNRDRGVDIQKHWDLIPKDTDILVTHGPPWGILDKTFKGDSAGCEALKETLDRLNPQLHLFGHIHEAYGQLESGKTTFINASIMNV
ncbi:MAG: metallophosphatase domain-containing protein, partial [Bacteroidota bacterium]